MDEFAQTGMAHSPLEGAFDRAYQSPIGWSNTQRLMETFGGEYVYVGSVITWQPDMSSDDRTCRVTDVLQGDFCWWNA